MKIGPIEKDIPLAPARARYPLHEMQVGDSFLVEFSQEEYKKVRGGIDAAIYRARHEWGYEFATRTIKNDETGRSMRIWRTK